MLDIWIYIHIYLPCNALDCLLQCSSTPFVHSFLVRRLAYHLRKCCDRRRIPAIHPYNLTLDPAHNGRSGDQGRAAPDLRGPVQQMQDPSLRGESGAGRFVECKHSFQNIGAAVDFHV